MKPSRQLTEAELRLMKVLWAKGRGTVGEIVETLGTEPQLAYSTVLTTLRILEGKGFLRHKKEGRAFVYEPIIGQAEASKGALMHLLSRFFDNSPELLVANLLQTKKISRKELDRIKQFIAEQK
jgi:predicted transcriptional regulator